ncbi:YitT family protein [Texas Phoenix palm phytoplasma]|uniref:YitT family protein n=1 Tax=Texas Phoenix palm phytoplasma TaxID=176709 RepID=UPI003CC827BE
MQKITKKSYLKLLKITLFDKKNIKTIFLSAFLCFLYTLTDVMFMSGDYKIQLYSTGIHGMGDAIAKILIYIDLFDFTKNKSFNGIFAASFFGFVNLLLFIFISFPKLDFKFSINSLINSILLIFFLSGLTFTINNPNGYLYNMHNFFGLFKSNDASFFPSLMRVLIGAILNGLICGYCIKIGSSTGGVDIIAKYLSIYKKKDISLLLTILNFCIGIFSVTFVSFWSRQINWISLFFTIIKEGKKLASFDLNNPKLYIYKLNYFVWALIHQKIFKLQNLY